jgi:signal transduction histidine kinase
MSYRSLKRVLGETSLERKCRFLFGACLLLLITGTFYWVDSIAEKLVIETTRSQGRDWVNIVIFNHHWEKWETDSTKRPLQMELSRDLLTENYESKILSLERAPFSFLPDGELPENKQEEDILRRLEGKWKQQLAQEAERTAGAEQRRSDAEATAKSTSAGESFPVFEELSLPDKGKYYYYQPVPWRKSCILCHERLQGDAFSAADQPSLWDRQSPPFRVVKVIMPYEATRTAIASTRAILIAVAILTVFVAMIALYVIVRYVIVKPLQHLRDVSDDISRGKTELRAEIHTGDEFEELAASFNRMLRHLTDTQSELRQVNTELDGKVDQLAQLNMRLYEMNRLKSDFLANMSHELRTPLNSIIGFSEVLHGIDSLTDKQKRYAQNIQKSGRLLLEMINDILDLAKMEAGKMDLRLSEFRLDTVINAQCDMVRSLTEEKNIDLDVEVQGDVPPLYQDQIKVQQILTNLLSNAIKFTPEGGRIVVAAGCDSRGRLEMTVADTGVGIAAEDREIIFEKFRQSTSVAGDDGLTREYSGTGLGLSIVKELCKLLGGEISFESELGKGSIFKVVLPWTRANQPQRDLDLAAALDDLAKTGHVGFPRHPITEPPVSTSR